MRGALGEKIGEGAFSDVHAWTPGQVVKLFKAGTSARLARHEARVTRAVFAAGAPAPEVLDEVTVDGRFGIVLSRLDGPTLLQLSRSGAMTTGQTGETLASLYRSVHRTPPPREVLFLRDWLVALQLTGGSVPPPLATGILALIERLRPGDGLCHADFHPGNVIMTAQGPRLVDWTGAVRGPAAFDLACGHIILTEFAAKTVADPQRPLAYDAAAQSAYTQLAGRSLAALTIEMEQYLPIACVIHLLWGAQGDLRERMIQRIEASLRAEDLI
jgi:aminoglycoside phosphotransferase (APT) family kinase protein